MCRIAVIEKYAPLIKRNTNLGLFCSALLSSKISHNILSVVLLTLVACEKKIKLKNLLRNFSIYIYRQ